MMKWGVIMNNRDKKKLLLPKTPFGIASVIFFCIVWWLLYNQPVMQIFDNMAKEGNIVWLLGMPINFVYIIVVAIITLAWSFAVFFLWEVDDDNE